MSGTAIVRKDLLLLVRDRRALAILVVMPLIFIAILGFSTGRLLGWRAENTILRIAVSDADGGEAARALVDALDAREGIRVIRSDDDEDAAARLSEGECSAAVRIGPAFDRTVDELGLSDVLVPTRGRLARGLAALDIHVETKASAPGTGGIVELLLWSQALQTITPRVARTDPRVGRFLESLPPPGETIPPEKTDQPDDKLSGSAGTASRGSRVYQILVPSYTVMFTFFLINIMARSFVAEREIGTLDRIRVSPVGTLAILFGKTLPFLIVSVIQGGMLFVAGRVLFGMSWGPHPEMLVPVVVCTSLSATGLGLLTATLVRTDAQVSAYANLFVITLAGISGCLMPRDWLPDLMREISLVTPHAWALIAFDQLLATPDPDLGRVVSCCAALVAFTVGFTLVGWLRFRAFRRA